MSSTKATPFKVSVQLDGHTGDVRSVAASHTGDAQGVRILSGSRDGTARVWERPAGSKSKRDVACSYVLEGQSGYVNCCAWLAKEGIAIAGGQDHTLNAYHIPPGPAPATPTSLTPDYTLLGHEDNVCALDVHAGVQPYIVSGSWDKTARVWKGWECVAVLGGHAQAVWAVLAVDDDHVLTASADKLIRLYSISKAAKEGNDGKPIVTFGGHTDVVRGLVRLNEGTFASCGNDGNIHVYPIVDAASFNASALVQPIQVLSGHTNYVYSLALLNTGELVSAGEDRSVRVWRDGALHQTITIPAISVWAVDALPNGDLTCASSDNFVRIFTRQPQRLADDDVLHAYDAAVSSQSLNKTQVGDVQKESLPGAEALAAPGREGQVKMVRNGDLVEAHQFSAVSGQWEKIGEVVGGVGSTQKKLFDGKEYDYVFDVDIEDGKPPLKLPYNASENPYGAAQRFLEKNELPMTYVDEVVRFIEKNTEGVQLGASDEYRDPYTGASSYRPGGSAGPAAPAAPPAVAATTVQPTSSMLPHAGALRFKQFNEQGAKSKIAELNGKVPPAAALSADESTAMGSLLASLSKLAASVDGPQMTGFNIDAQQLSNLLVVLQRWPLALRFPLLDVFRLACLSQRVGNGDAIVSALDAAQWSAAWPSTPEEAKTRATLSMLALRAIANALSSGAADQVAQVLTSIQRGDHAAHLTKPGRVAYATVLLNCSALLVGAAPSSAPASQLLSSISQFLSSESRQADRDSEAIYRACVAFGNMVVSRSSGTLGVGAVHAAQSAMQAAVGGVSEARLQSLVREIDAKSVIA